MAVENTPSVATIPLPAKQRRSAWLVYSILTLVLWGFWGATSKVVSDQIDAYTNQVLFGIGMVPDGTQRDIAAALSGLQLAVRQLDPNLALFDGRDLEAAHGAAVVFRRTLLLSCSECRTIDF